MSRPAGEASRGNPAEAQAAIERFLKASRQPALLEPGEELFPLEPGNFAVNHRDGRLSVQVWDQTRNLYRRVMGVREESAGKLELVIERFGKKPGRLLLLDLARPAHLGVGLREKRLTFREHFRLFLSREFPGWRISGLTSEVNLEYSLSPVYPRALLKKGGAGIAALACPPGGDAAGALSFGLIWLDYLRRRERRTTVEALTLFLPQGTERTACLRLRFLDSCAARFLPFVYAAEGYAEQVDLRDYGNLDTKLDTCRDASSVQDARLREWVERLGGLPYVERVALNDGSISLRVRGLQFARASAGELTFGLRELTPARDANLSEIERLADALARLRAPSPPDRGNPLYRLQPEHWLEAQVRANLEEVDAALMPLPVYSQVPAFAGGERGVIDLLAAERGGRLAVLELKASEDLHLPLQALDYWMRVKWHLDRGEFSEKGYFPGVTLSKQSPKLLLVAPSLEFHPTTETILRYVSPDVPVERVGVAIEWRKSLKVVFRARGAQRPL